MTNITYRNNLNRALTYIEGDNNITAILELIDAQRNFLLQSIDERVLYTQLNSELQTIINTLRGNANVNGDTLEKLYNLIVNISLTPGDTGAKGDKGDTGSNGTGKIDIKTISNNYTLLIEDAYNTLIRTNNLIASPITITVPANSTVNFEVGSNILISRNNTGTVTLVPENGTVTILTPETLSINKQYGKITLIKTDVNLWEVEGNLTPNAT